MKKSDITKRGIAIFIALSAIFSLTGCNEDVVIFRKEKPKGVQEPVKPTDMEMGLYYVKDGTQFIQTLPLHGSGADRLPDSALYDDNKSRVLYAGPYEDTLIPTHYKGELVAMADKEAGWTNVTLERYKDLGYTVGFVNAKYNKTENALEFTMNESGIKETDFETKVSELESKDIRVVELDHEPLNSTNCNPDCGVLIGMGKGETHVVSLYSGTYYHEIEVVADTQVFQSFEVYAFGSENVTDTPNGYRGFEMPDNLKCGYYAINGKGLFRYVDFIKGEGDVSNAPVNEAYYKSNMEQLAQFSKQYSFYAEQRVKNMSVRAYYDEESVSSEEDIKGYAFAPDGTEYRFTVNADKDSIYLDLTEAMPGRWVVNIVPMTINILEFTATDNTPDQELTQERYEINLDEPKENVIIRAYFEPSTKIQNLNDVNIGGTIITPDGTTYVMEKGTEKSLTGEMQYYLEYALAYAPEGTYEVDINHYPERTTVSDPQIVNNTETHTETIVIEG